MGLESIWINHACGDVRMCGWTQYVIGNLLENSIEELWHGEKAEKFRNLIWAVRDARKDKICEKMGL